MRFNHKIIVSYQNFNKDKNVFKNQSLIKVKRIINKKIDLSIKIIIKITKISNKLTKLIREIKIV